MGELHEVKHTLCCFFPESWIWWRLSSYLQDHRSG